jgi:hypothetical protein
MADKRLLTIHLPVRLNAEFAELMRVIGEQYDGPLARKVSDGIAVYLPSMYRRSA